MIQSIDDKVIKKIKTGCTDPMSGFRKKCVIDIIKVDKDGNSFGKQKMKKNIKLVSVSKSKIKGKKLTAKFEINGSTRTIHFGAAGMSDFTKHKDPKRRENYLKRTANMKGNWKDDMYSPNNLSRNLLW